MRLSFQEIVKATNAKILKGSETGETFGFSTDSRTVESGQIYIALSGEKFDGHDFLTSVKEKGASGCIISDKTKLTDDFDFVFLVMTLK